VHKATDVNHLDLGLAVPFRVAIDIFGNEDYVSLGNVELLIQIDVGTASFYNQSQSGFAAVAVSAAEMVFVKYVSGR
jgi:hypothetical protein